jgi:hypothetical protein
MGTGDEDTDETIDVEIDDVWTDDDDEQENETGDCDGELSGVSDNDERQDSVLGLIGFSLLFTLDGVL